MYFWLALAIILCTGSSVLSISEHTIQKRQIQYPQRSRFRTGFQVAVEPQEAVTEYVEPYFQQQPPGYARVPTGIRGSQQPSFTVTDEVDHQPPDYDQEAPGPRYVVTTPVGPQTPYGPQRRRPQYPISPATVEVPQGPRLTQQDLTPISYATQRRPPQAPVPPPQPSQTPPSSSFRVADDSEEAPEELTAPQPPPAPPARTVLISQGPTPSRPPLNFGGAALVTQDKPEPPPTTRPPRVRTGQRRIRTTTPAPSTTAQTPPPPAPTRRAPAKRPVVRLQNTQSNPTPPPARQTTKPATTKRPAVVPYNPDLNLAPPSDEEEFIQSVTEAGPRKFSRRPTEVAKVAETTTTPAPRVTTARRPGGKKLKIGTLAARPSTTTTTTEAPVEYDDDYEDPPPPKPSSRRTPARSSAPKPAVVYEEPDESQAEPAKQAPPPPQRTRASGRPTNKAFKPRPVDDYEYDDEEEPRPSRSRDRSRTREDYDDQGTYIERPYRSRSKSRSRGRPGPPTSPKPTRRVPPKDLPKRKDGRVIDYLGDPNFPRELSGYDMTEYPFFVTLPDDVSHFDCEERSNGFYASVPHQCQVFHYCFGGNRFSFLCANYTLYDQTTFTCQFANKVNCVTSERYYNRNDDLYKEKPKETEKPKKDKDPDLPTTTTTPAPPRVFTSRRPAGKKLKIGTLGPRFTTTTTEAPFEDPLPRSSSRRTQ